MQVEDIVHPTIQKFNREGHEKIIKRLSDLMQLDIDAVEAYEQALKNIETTMIHSQIASFQNDHKQHINDLSRLITKLGGEPPERTKDFKGFFIKGMTALRSAMGEQSALKAMYANEELTNKTYSKALEEGELSVEARLLVEKNYADEQRHLAYIHSVIEA